jgi:hypothetical protein
VVAERVDDPPLAQPVRLIGRREHLRRPGRHRLCRDGAIGMGVMSLGGLVGGAIATTTSPASSLVVAGVVGGSSVLPTLSRSMLALRV